MDDLFLPRKSTSNVQKDSVLPFCSGLSKYNILEYIGEGTFGKVFKGSVIENNKPCVVAIKKIKKSNENQGFPLTSVTEIQILNKLNHDNIVKLLEVCQSEPIINKTNYQTTFYLIFEFCDHDLAGLLSRNDIKFKSSEIKELMKQLVNGVYYIHANKILHCDIKSANILVTKNGVLKIADFGLSRAFSDLPGVLSCKYTIRVVTLWYRPPELLLCDLDYGSPIDLWGVGCVMAEMFTRRPIMRGITEKGQLLEIIKVCGSINPEVWPNVEKLKLYNCIQLPNNPGQKAKDYLANYTRDKLACDLFGQFLTYDPSKRINAELALKHGFFWSDPMPCRKSLAKKMTKIHNKNFNYQNKFS